MSAATSLGYSYQRFRWPLQSLPFSSFSSHARCLGLRVLILLEFEVRQKLAARGSKLAGLYAGQAKRSTARPTAEKLLAAFDGITLTRVKQSTQKY